MSGRDVMEVLSPAAEVLPLWIVILNHVQLAITIAGIVSNLCTLITLIKNGDDFSEIICLLLRYQSVMDFLACLLNVLLFSVPGFWTIGVYWLDLLICQIWHGQYVYWAALLISIWNLVALALERYICVCHPLKYTLLTKSKIRLVVLGCVIIGLIGPSGSLLQVRMDGAQCVSEYLNNSQSMKIYFMIFAISTFFTFYALPCVLFVVFYGMVIASFRKRSKQSLGASGTVSVIDRASAELTKTAVVVTLVFVVTQTFENWYYFLAYCGFAEYKMNSPTQKISAFLSIINSVANPFVYASLMPAYRRSMQKTFHLPCWSGK